MSTLMKRVLIVDDNDEAATNLARLCRASWKLPEIPLEIICVRTLAEGLAEAPDANVTILDLTLADADPDEVILSIPSFRPPVIVLTGDGDPTIGARCLEAGADHVFIKGSIIGFIPAFFKALARDVIQRAENKDGPET